MKHVGLFCLIVFLLPGCNPEYFKFDTNPPGLIPKVFAKCITAPNNEHVGYCAFSPDGSDLYYAVTNDDWSESKILHVSTHNLGRKDTLYLKDRIYEGEPFVARDGKTMFFTVILKPVEGEIWQSNIYKVNKTQSGWSDPEILDSTINSSASEWHISLTDKNIAYFTSERENGTSALHGDIFRAELQEGKFINLTKLPNPINTYYNDSDPLIAPDESYLIFHSNRAGGYGEHDLYISFNKNGKWTDPVNMGENINTSGWEMAPSLTPDCKYLLFTRRKALITKEPAQIYWVDANIVKNYK